MKAFSDLLERLVFTPSRNAKLALLEDYFRSTPDPDRGYALAALTGGLSFKNVKAGVIRQLIEGRVDPVLFGWSYDYVGDLAETAALIWPEERRANRQPSLSEVVEAMSSTTRAQAPALLETWMDSLGSEARFALLKLITGGLRVGVSERLTKTALANLGGREVSEVEEVWHGLQPPYEPLFAWLEGRGERPEIDPRAAFRPMMLANPVVEADFSRMEASDYRAATCVRTTMPRNGSGTGFASSSLPVPRGCTFFHGRGKRSARLSPISWRLARDWMPCWTASCSS